MLDGLQVSDAGNHLVVSGEFAPERHEDWQGVQRWFDQRYGSSQVLVSNAKLSLIADQPTFRFQAVWGWVITLMSLVPKARDCTRGHLCRKAGCLPLSATKGLPCAVATEEFF